MKITVKLKFVEGVPVLQPACATARAMADLMRVPAFSLAAIDRIKKTGIAVNLQPDFCSVNH